MSGFEVNKQHLREVLIFFFHWKKSAAEAHRTLVEVYGDSAPTDKTCREWFRRFKDGDFSVDDRLCIWWDQKGVVYYELLKPGESITGNRYRVQLMRLSRALREKRPQYEQRHEKVILLHDNAKPHVAKPVKQYLETLKWDVLPHPPYSPDIAPSDYWLFRRMQNDLTGQRFTSYKEIQKWLETWMSERDELFYRDTRNAPLISKFTHSLAVENAFEIITQKKKKLL